MATAVLIIVLLTVAASLASWLFGQWLAQRSRVSGAALALGGGGALVMVGTAAFVIITATTWWQKLVPVFDSSPLIAPAAAPTSSAAPATTGATSHAAQYADYIEVDIAQYAEVVASDLTGSSGISRRLELSAPALHVPGSKQDLLAAAENHLERSEYAAAIGIARGYLATDPRDADMLSMLARSTFAAEHPAGQRSADIPDRNVAAPAWPATTCVAALRSEQASRWMLDNRCGGALAVLFASCQLGESACFSGVGVSAAWSYEPAGILMTGANDRPVAVRVADGGPLVAPIFAIRDSAGARRQIRYLACEVTAPGVLRLLREVAAEELTQQRLAAELRADACYAQVLDWARNGQRLGRPPDALLRDAFTTGNQQ